MGKFQIQNPPKSLADADLVTLLTKAYVDGGFTTPERAATIFKPCEVRSRGNLICARTIEDDSLAGMVIVVLPDYPARRMAKSDEAELHLLAVAPQSRGLGLGRLLVSTALETINAHGLRRAILWTQPSMIVAQRLYENLGFVRVPGRDPTFDGMKFFAYEKRWH